MLITMERVGPKLTEDSIINFEKKSGYKLPVVYKDFLLKYNGGKPRPDTYDVPSWQHGYSTVNDFNGILPGEYNDIEDNIRLLRGRLPTGFIPIADDPGGNVLLLCLAGSTTSKVYFWDHENEPYERGDRLEDYPNIHWVADSFTDLLNKLR